MGRECPISSVSNMVLHLSSISVHRSLVTRHSPKTVTAVTESEYWIQKALALRALQSSAAHVFCHLPAAACGWGPRSRGWCSLCYSTCSS